MKHLRKVAITGAGGKMGRVVSEAFRKAGWRVVGIDRRASQGIVAGDLSDATQINAITEAMKGCDAVVNLVGLVDYSASREALWNANVQTTKNALAAAKKAAVKRFVHCSSTSVHRIPKYLPIDEKHPFTPINNYGKAKLDAEKAVRESGLPFVIIRPSVVYGPSFAPNFEKFAKAALQAKMPVIGSGGNRVGYVYQEDLAKAFVLAATSPAALGETFIIASDEEITQLQAMQAFCKAIGAPAPSKSVSKRKAYFACRLEWLKQKLLGKRPKLSFEDVHSLAEERYYEVSKARKLLGWRPETKFSQGVREMAAELKRLLKTTPTAASKTQV